MKVKLKVVRKCPNGETYHFENGIAVVPGMVHRNGAPYLITLKEFNEIIKEMQKEGV